MSRRCLAHRASLRAAAAGRRRGRAGLPFGKPCLKAFPVQSGSYSAAVKRLAHASGVTISTRRPMAGHKPMTIGPGALRSPSYSFEEATSSRACRRTDGVEVSAGRGEEQQPCAGHTAGPSWLPRLSKTTMSPGIRPCRLRSRSRCFARCFGPARNTKRHGPRPGSPDVADGRTRPRGSGRPPPAPSVARLQNRSSRAADQRRHSSPSAAQGHDLVGHRGSLGFGVGRRNPTLPGNRR